MTTKETWRPSKPIVLVGYRCCGKSAVARTLAQRWNLPCIDTDALVEEQAGISIYQIFVSQGELEFRRLEHEVLQSLDPNTASVIATGGGIVAAQHNHALLRQLGTIVFLNSTSKTLRKRMLRREQEDGPSPSLTGNNWKDEVDIMLPQRNPLYRAVTDVELNADHSLELVVNMTAAAVETL